MNVKTTTSGALRIELDDRCAMPIRVQEAANPDPDFPDLDSSEPKYFRWQIRRRRDDPEELNVEFGEGTLSPAQNIALLLHRASRATGEYVKLLPRCHFCPALVGDDDQLVGLYQFVEVLDGIIDYDKIRAELPTLSFAQINGSLMFLRKVSQFNINDIDIDEIEDDQFENDAAFVAELKQAVADQQTTRVLNYDKRDD